jgi:hypothetical protein
MAGQRYTPMGTEIMGMVNSLVSESFAVADSTKPLNVKRPGVIHVMSVKVMA